MKRGLPKGPFEATWKSLKKFETPDWYLDGKFGIFMHWGVYSVPAFANEWYPRNMYRQGTPEFEHHVRTYGPQAKFGYKDFIPQFKAERFDPDEWARLFREAGAKFVVPVAEHHDGFAMYATKFNRWNAAEMGPKRDVIGELAKAVRRQGMVFGLSTHRAEHWWFMNGGREFDSDVQDPACEDFYGPAKPETDVPTAAYLEDWLRRTCELVDRFRPQIVWFDWWIEQPCFVPYLKRFAAYYYNRGAQWGKGVAINYKNKAYPDGAAVLDLERGQLAGIRKLFWQNDTSVMKNSWSAIADPDYKTVESVVQDLVDVVSKNGALLLNIGPRADGAIAPHEQGMLREIGRWLKVNGEAIYGTRPWRVFGEGPTEVPEGMFMDTKRQPFTAQDFRFTTKGATRFAIALGWPNDGPFTIRSLARGRPIRSVRMLGSRANLKWTQTSQGLIVHPPERRPCDHAYVLKIE